MAKNSDMRPSDMRRHCYRRGERLRLCVTREEYEKNALVRIQCEHGHWNRVRARRPWARTNKKQTQRGVRCAVVGRLV